MKDKIKKNYLNQSTVKGLSPSIGDYTFKKQIRRTLGSQQDLVDKISWNTLSQNLSHFYSPPKTKFEQFDLHNIIQQNKRLKEEVKQLKQLLIDSGIISKTYQKIDSMSRLKKNEKTEQIQKLKKIIQKSHHSIKYMQSQLLRKNQQNQATSYNLTNLQKKYKILQFQKQQLQHKISNINQIHQKQIQVCHERIRRLNVVTQQLVEMNEQDKRNWALHMEELNNLKKFYSNRTYK